MTRMVPENPSPHQAWKAIKAICTRNPQRDEVYSVLTAGLVYECHREIWIMRKTVCGCFQFLCYNPHVVTGYVKGRVKIWKNFQEPKRQIITSQKWATKVAHNRATFMGFLCTYRKDERGT